MRKSASRLIRCTRGAIAPTIGLSLFALVAVGGLAFDYARMAAVDTELQQAADQAALAAASQLDGEAGAINRATAAAQSLISNLTYFANDGGTPTVSVPTILFYRSYDPATGAKGPVASTDAEANYVLVTVGARQARFALTPIVGVFSSGDLTASAFAGLESAYCNLPPFMLCKPNANFDASQHIGHGMRLVIGAPTAPGNFGFLQTGFGTGAENLAKAIGWNGSAGGCVAARGVITEPGNKQSVRAALNTRFDLSESGQTCPSGGTCAPSTNSRKDLVHDQNGNNCGFGGQKGWRESDFPYRAPNTSPLSASNPMIPGSPARIYPDIMGHPRDLCHAVSEAGTCAAPGIVGDGTWDRDAYFAVNYGWDNSTWMSRTGLAANATRYQIYLWEAANPLPDGPGAAIGIGKNQAVGTGNDTRWTSSWTGSSPNPQRTCRDPGVPPFDPDQDRRRTAAAVVDCTGLNGRDTVKPVDWVDLFLVEPTIKRPASGGPSRTDNGDIYVEIISTKPLPGIGQSIGNIVRRDVPRLIE